MRIAFVILGGVFLFCAGFISRMYIEKEKPAKIEYVWENKTVSDHIDRNYPTMSADECIASLQCYDKGDFAIEKHDLDGETVRINASLCERTAYRDLKIKSSSRIMRNILNPDFLLVYEKGFRPMYGIRYFREVTRNIYIGGGGYYGSNAIALSCGMQIIF